MATRPISPGREALTAILEILADQDLLTRRTSARRSGELDGAGPDANGRGRPDIYMSKHLQSNG